MKNRNTIKLAEFRKIFRTGKCLIAALHLALFLSVAPLHSIAKEEPGYEEISVLLNMPAVGGLEIPAVIRDQELYLPVTDVFNFLKINHTVSSGLDSVSGFFIHPQSIYLIDITNHEIIYNGKVFDLKPEQWIRTETNVYIRSDLFGKIFDLHCVFNFRSLSVVLDTKLEVPVIREMRQEMIRRNIKKIKGEIKADTIIGRRYSFFHPGMLDWSVVSTQRIKDGHETRFNVRSGMMLAGGEATVVLNYSTDAPFQQRQQFYQWRFVNNNSKMVRQVAVGNIATQATSSIFSPVAGIQVSNSPTLYRQSFGTYTLTNRTQPDWTVELYVNNVLLDYTKADASGFFTFNVPLIYGNTTVTLRFYGPSGEERSSEQHINIPFSFLPKGTFEYSVNAGIVLDTLNSRFSRLTMNYGLNRRVTIGGGVEYLSSVISGKKMPFLNTTVRLTSNFLFSGEYTYNVRSKATVSYRRPSNFQLELNYIKYAKGQQAINNNFLEERKMSASMPLRIKNTLLFSRLSVSQFVVPTIGYAAIMQTKYKDIPKLQYTAAELMVSGAIQQFNANLLTYCVFPQASKADIYSNLSLGYRFFPGLSFRSQFQYNYRQGSFITMKYDLEKRLSDKGFMNLSYEKNFISGTYNVLIGMRYDLSFVRTLFSVNSSNKTTTFMQSASGSLMYNKKTKFVGATNIPTAGKGGITLLPFLDINGNSKKDADEPAISGLKFRINGGRVLPNNGKAIIRIINLEPYVNYLIELDGNSFGNIAWQIKKKNISVAVDPNCFKLIEIPVSILNEFSGMVLLKTNHHQKGLSGILVNIYDTSSKQVMQILTESDGYFSYLGLQAGSYTARIDSVQLKKLNLRSTPETLSFTIVSSQEGVIVDGFEFVLEALTAVSEKETSTDAEPLVANPHQ